MPCRGDAKCPWTKGRNIIVQCSLFAGRKTCCWRTFGPLSWGKSVERERHFSLSLSPSPGGLSPPIPPFLSQRRGEKTRRGKRRKRRPPSSWKRRRVVPIRAEWSQGEEVHKNPLLRIGASSLLQPFVIQGILSPGIYPSAHICFFLCVERKKV